MVGKTATSITRGTLLSDMVTFVLKQVNGYTPALFKDHVVRDGYTTHWERVCLCIKKPQYDYIDVIDVIKIELNRNNRNVEYLIYDSSSLEERVRLALENIGDLLHDRMKEKYGMDVRVLPRDLTLLKMPQRSEES